MEAVLARHVVAGVVSCAITYYLVPHMATCATYFGLIDAPDGKLKHQKKPVPYLGGLAVYLGFIVTLVLLYPWTNMLFWLMAGSSLLLLVGLIDDLKVLTPLQKFAGQLVAVALFLTGGFSIKTHFFASWAHLGCSAFWMLTVINAINLVDIMDGLATTIALCATLTFFGIALFFGQYTVSILLIGLAGSLVAFFLHNKPPAHIYLGDAGALFLGGFLAATPLLLPWSSAGNLGIYVPAIVLAIPVVEVCCLVAIRTWLGIPFFRGSPHHFAIFLQRKGWSKERVLLFCVLTGGMLASIAALALSNVVNVYGMIALLFGLATWYGYVVFYGVQLSTQAPQTKQSS